MKLAQDNADWCKCVVSLDQEPVKLLSTLVLIFGGGSKDKAFHAGTIQISANLFNGKVMFIIWRVEIVGTRVHMYEMLGQVHCARKFSFPIIDQ